MGKRLVIRWHFALTPALAKPCRMDAKGRARRFIKGHHAGQPASVNALATYRGNRTGVTPWNKGRSYVMAKREVYAV